MYAHAYVATRGIKWKLSSRINSNQAPGLNRKISWRKSIIKPRNEIINSNQAEIKEKETHVHVAASKQK